MRRWLIFVIAMSANGQSASAPLLDRIKAHIEDNLKRLPDYTCTEIIARSLRPKRHGKFQAEDTVRLNVAYVGGKELFGLPDKGKLEHANLSKLVNGPSGNGQFALFLRSIFLRQGVEFSSPRKTELDGTPSFRFEYRVPGAQGDLLIKSATGEAVVGYSGSFWVAQSTLDLLRIIVSADNLPYRLEIASDVTTTGYGPVVIAGRQFLLPLRSTYEVRDVYGSEVRNLMTFENCREFVGESVLKFGDPEPTPANK